METIQKAGALIINDKKLMIVRPYGKPFFINPGGKYETGESSEECLRRELREELDVDLKSYKFYKTYAISKAGHSKLPLSLELYIVSVKGEPKPSSEIEMIEWLGLEEFANHKFNLAPSFYEYIPGLISDGLL